MTDRSALGISETRLLKRTCFDIVIGQLTKPLFIRHRSSPYSSLVGTLVNKQLQGYNTKGCLCPLARTLGLLQRARARTYSHPCSDARISNAAGVWPTLAVMSVMLAPKLGGNSTPSFDDHVLPNSQIYASTPIPVRAMVKEALRKLPADPALPFLITRQAVCSFIRASLRS